MDCSSYFLYSNVEVARGGGKAHKNGIFYYWNEVSWLGIEMGDIMYELNF